MMDWAIVASGIGFLVLFVLFFVARIIIQALHDGLDDLDSKIADALKQVIAQGVGDFEPPTPIPAALAQFIANKLDKDQNIVEAVVSDKKS